MNMNITSIKEEITTNFSNRLLSYNLRMKPGLYDVSLFVWANGALGNSTITANGMTASIQSNGAVQIDGIKTIDEIVLTNVEVKENGTLDVDIMIDEVADDLFGILENLVVKKSRNFGESKRVYIDINPDELVTGLENGYYTLTVLTKYSGGDDLHYLEVDNGAKTMTTGIPRNNFPYETGVDWKKVTLRGIEVTSGTLSATIKTISSAKPNCQVKDFKLEKNDQPFEFLNGGDITELTYTEDMGGKYYDFDGNQVDPLEFLAANGWNMVRIRIYNYPGKGRGEGGFYVPEGYQDLPDALKLAKRAKDAGLKIQFSFHYSDYWTNPGRHMVPHAWLKLVEGKQVDEAVDILEEELYKFTKDALEQLVAQGTPPDVISVGNETRNGMLFPYGSTDNFDALARFYNAGTRAIREVTPDSIAMIHLDDGGNLNTYIDHFGNARDRNVDFDMIGTSYYPYWTQKTAAKFGSFAVDVAREFGKPIMIMETAINFTSHTASGRIGQLTNNGPYGDKDTSTPELQRDFYIELFNEMQGVEDGMCVGSQYWDPIMIYADGNTGWAISEETGKHVGNVIDNTTVFDFDGKALPVIHAYRMNKRK